MQRRHPRGFTLVELLVVIAIIGILVALLLPAIQSAREAGRRSTCANNLKNVGMGFILHQEANKNFPTGGWGWGWCGDPNRGFNRRQPGGWGMTILPFIEEKAVFEKGKGLTGAALRAANRDRMSTSIQIYNCPTRRRPERFPFKGGNSFKNAELPEFVGRTDYAACGGSQGYNSNGFSPINGPAESALTQTEAAVEAFYNPTTLSGMNGISTIRSETTPRKVIDGLSKTYMVGEKYLPYLRVEGGDGSNGDDNQSWDTSYDWDTYRWTNIYNLSTGAFLAKDGKGAYPGEPWSDFGPGDLVTNNQNFGSSHTSVFIMVMADGSVHQMPFDIDLRLHQSLGSRNDSKPTGEVKY